MSGGDDASPSSVLSLPIIPQRMRFSKRRTTRPRFEQEGPTPAEHITVEADKEAPHPMALKPKEAADLIPKKWLIIGHPSQIEVESIVASPRSPGSPPSHVKKATNEREPSGDASKIPVQASVISSCPTINNYKVISLSLPGGADVFTNPWPMAIQLPKLLNHQEWAQMDSMNSAALVTQIIHEVSKVNYLMDLFLFVLALLEFVFSFFFPSSFFQRSLLPLLFRPQEGLVWHGHS